MATAHDLTLRNAAFLDKHLVFPLLEFLSQRGVYDGADIEAAKLELIGRTNMVDYAVDIYQQLHQTNEVCDFLFEEGIERRRRPPRCCRPPAAARSRPRAPPIARLDRARLSPSFAPPPTLS
jgi:hypothetical protein